MKELVNWTRLLLFAALSACSGGDAPLAANDDNADAGDDNPAPAQAGNPAPSGSGHGDWGPGDYPPDLAAQTYLEISDLPGQNGNTRQYKVHVPPGYDREQPTPVVFCFHGFTQNAVLFCVDGSELTAKADAAGFILVMPNGYQNSWNGGGCCGAAESEQLDDVAFVRAVLEEISAHLNVDRDRVYATGESNGGYMSYRLACEAADVFAAVAPGAGGIVQAELAGCQPSRPISVLDIHGTADALVAYSLQQPSLERLAASNGCSLTTEAAAVPASGGDTTCVTYRDCPPGVEVTGCSVEGGGHCWFGSPNCGAGPGAAGLESIIGANSDTLVNNDAVWDFFSRLSR